LFRLINQLKQGDDDIVVEAGAPTILKDTATNLKAAIAGENYETTDMYPSFANEAEEEGHADIAKRLRAIAKAESHHRDRYTKLLKEVEQATVFKKAEKTYWVCRKCGYIHEAESAPEECPSCGHPQAYFQVQAEVY
jgi:rubrerythrin